MRIGVAILPDSGWSQLRPRWLEAEQLGFTTAWTYDHLSWRSLRDGPWLGTVPLLGAVVEATTTLRVGTLVTSPNFRHPALLAKDVMTLDQVSGGRVDLGVGAGGTGYDALVLGADPLSPQDRAARFEEFVDVLDALLRDQSASHSGRFYAVHESRTYPGCVQQPRVPFTVAGAGPRAMRVAAAHAHTWVTYGPVRGHEGPDDWFAAVEAQVGRLREACEAVGRDPSSIRRMALAGLESRWQQSSVAAWDDFCARLETLGFTDVVLHWPRPEDPELPGPPVGVFDEISARLRP
jgi:alkanesulfonate monooxygenase SsuD/methylene tetrahydromethanopterin reductase-like flavin-dependent oxidoreductase (luciferase family)